MIEIARHTHTQPKLCSHKPHTDLLASKESRTTSALPGLQHYKIHRQHAAVIQLWKPTLYRLYSLNTPRFEKKTKGVANVRHHAAWTVRQDRVI